MFDWIGDLIDAIAEAIREAFEFLGTQISNTIWNTMLRWFYETIYYAVDVYKRQEQSRGVVGLYAHRC